jgi:DNA invertase Pin-like site-specific DNA recombinase
MTGKIQSLHLERRAYVYVRQSTTMQVLENTESTGRQYGLVERARALGWSADAIEVIDEDLGRSGATTKDRSGFGRLAEAVAHGRAGAIFAVEVSRLARSSQDWQRLLALCAVAQVVVADEHAVYDPQNCDDKLLLDFKGTMSEAELHWLRLRLTGAQRRKAGRGELRFHPPTGYVWGDHGLELDPDLAVRHAIAAIFARFSIEPTANAVVRWANQQGFLVPTRRSFADGTDELTWKPLGISRLKEILNSPIYAGAYAYGRRAEKRILVDGEIRSVRECRDPNDWVALIRGTHEGYLTWETYMRNRDKMRQNSARCSEPGAPREGRALLAGILLCGRCGRRMRTTYPRGRDDQWTYMCHGEQDRGAPICWSVRGRAIDAAVEALFLQMIIPGELDLTLAVEHEADAQAASLHEQWRLRLEKAEYEARRAERRYMAVDPDNRTVARTLEGDWEARLRDLEAVRQRHEAAKREHRVQLTDQDRRRIRELAQDLPAVWHAPTTRPADRKAMLRIAIEAVAVRPIDVPQRLTHIHVQWRSGAVDELTTPRPSSAEWHRTPGQVVERIRQLTARGLPDEKIVEHLRAEHVQSGSGRPWTANAVKHVRCKHSMERPARKPCGRAALPDRHPDGRYSMRGAIKRFGVSERQVSRWIGLGIIAAVREDFPPYRDVWWLTIDDVTARRLDQRRTTKYTTRKTAGYADRGDGS